MACAEHRCLKLCGQLCGECKFVVEKIPPCGHSANLACSTDPLKYVCTVQVSVELRCGHTSEKVCSKKSTPTCKLPCGGFLNCGHPCQALCHSVLGISDHRDEASRNNTVQNFYGVKVIILVP